MKQHPLVGKGLVVLVVTLFVGVAVIPSLTSNIVKASIGKRIVEITEQRYQKLKNNFADLKGRLNTPMQSFNFSRLIKKIIILFIIIIGVPLIYLITVVLSFPFFLLDNIINHYPGPIITSLYESLTWLPSIILLVLFMLMMYGHWP